MQPAVRAARAADLPWAVDLIDRHRGDGLDEAERARRGFVQGTWTVTGLQELIDGIVLAEVDGERAGVAISSPPGRFTAGPAGRTNELAAERFGAGRYVLYGPVVVDDGFRRRGVLAALTTGLFAALADRYETAVAFIESSNAASLAAHGRLGWTPFATFEIGARRFQVLSRDLDPPARP